MYTVCNTIQIFSNNSNDIIIIRYNKWQAFVFSYVSTILRILDLTLVKSRHGKTRDLRDPRLRKCENLYKNSVKNIILHKQQTFLNLNWQNQVLWNILKNKILGRGNKTNVCLLVVEGYSSIISPLFLLFFLLCFFFFFWQWENKVNSLCWN